jgi:hypothetical protein
MYMGHEQFFSIKMQCAGSIFRKHSLKCYIVPISTFHTQHFSFLFMQLSSETVFLGYFPFGGVYIPMSSGIVLFPYLIFIFSIIHVFYIYEYILRQELG